jgi:hypothetical protein
MRQVRNGCPGGADNEAANESDDALTPQGVLEVITPPPPPLLLLLLPPPPPLPADLCNRRFANVLLQPNYSFKRGYRPQHPAFPFP